MDERGNKAPRNLAQTAYVFGVLVGLTGVVSGLVYGRTSVAAGGDLLSPTPAVNNWPAGIAIMVAGVMVWFALICVGVFANWAAAMYEAQFTEDAPKP